MPLFSILMHLLPCEFMNIDFFSVIFWNICIIYSLLTQPLQYRDTLNAIMTIGYNRVSVYAGKPANIIRVILVISFFTFFVFQLALTIVCVVIESQWSYLVDENYPSIFVFSLFISLTPLCFDIFLSTPCITYGLSERYSCVAVLAYCYVSYMCKLKISWWLVMLKHQKKVL